MHKERKQEVIEIKGMKINLRELATMLVKAKLSTYASETSKEITPQRPDFKELEYEDGDWNYRDSYSGFFYAPGQEIMRYKNVPIWAMSYGGGMLPKHHGDVAFAKQTFSFLKKALSKVDESRPFRGPVSLIEGDWEYRSSNEGDIKDFSGVEHILYKGEVVFKQYFIGGLIIPK